MHPYVWIPLLACAASAFTAGMILARDPAARVNRQLALLGVCTAFWALCEVLWNTSRDPEVALRFVKLSALGWIWVGPIVLSGCLAAAEEPAPWAKRLLRVGYATGAALIVLEWTTDWLHPRVVPTSWGWGYEFGPLFPIYYLLSMGGVGLGIRAGVRAYRRYASPAERSQGVLALGAVAVPLVVGSLTDGFLPAVGIQVPRLGTSALALLGATVAWSYFRFGYSLLSSGRFAPEILESLADGVVLVRPNGHVRIANGGMGRLLGCPAEAVQGRHLRQLLPFVPLHPPTEVDDLEGDLCSISGLRIPVSVSTSLVRDRRGLPIGVVLIVHDLREIVALRNRLVTSGRLAAVGQLAAGIAHEINNPIAYVRSNLGMLEGYWEELEKELDSERRGRLKDVVEEGRELIAESLEGIDRAAAIVRDVKGFSHAGEGERIPVDLNPLLDRVLRIAEPQLRNRARVEKHYAQLPPIPCVPQELQQVFLNLVLNAGQAVRPGGRISIRTALEEDAVVVTVEDEGCGIAAEDVERIFDPFFTTKPVGEGTGLGLAISYQIVRSHGGEISVESRSGQGTRFSIRLPVG
jgi:signal transduction histidine kinase